MKPQYTLPLALGMVLASQPAKDAAKDAFNYFKGSSNGIERVVQSPEKNRLEELLGGVAYGQTIDSKARAPPYEPDQQQDISNIINVYQTHVKDKLNFSKDYKKVVEYLSPVENFMAYDFSKIEERKRKDLAEIFNDYAVALKLLKGQNNDNDYAKIINLYRASMKLDQNLKGPKINLAFLIYQKKLGDYQNALQLIEEVLKQDPNNESAKFLKEKLEKLI